MQQLSSRFLNLRGAETSRVTSALSLDTLAMPPKELLKKLILSGLDYATSKRGQLPNPAASKLTGLHVPSNPRSILAAVMPTLVTKTAEKLTSVKADQEPTTDRVGFSKFLHDSVAPAIMTAAAFLYKEILTNKLIWRRHPVIAGASLLIGGLGFIASPIFDSAEKFIAKRRSANQE